MNAVRLPRRSLAIIVLAVLVIAGCMVFATWRLLKVEDHSQLIVTENYLWFVTQAQYDGVRLAESLARMAAGDSIAAGETPKERLDILLSRLDLFMSGPPRRVLEHSGSFSRISEIAQGLQSLEPRLGASLSREEALDLRNAAAGHARDLRDVANNISNFDQVHVTASINLYRRVVMESLALLLVTFLSTLVVVLYLLRGIREKKRAERLLRQEQQFSDLVINLGHQGIVILDERLHCLLWNPGMEALLGVRTQDVVGGPLALRVPLFGRERVGEALAEALRGRSASVEEDSVFPGFRSGCVEVSCHHLRMSERDLVIAFVRDVTEQWQRRKQAEQQNVDLENKVRQRTAALRQAESRLLAAIRTAPDGFAAFDTNGKLLIANERIRSIETLRDCFREDMSLAAFLSCFALCDGADERLLTAGHSFEPLELDLQLQMDSWAHLSVTRADQGTVFVRLTDVTPYKKAAHALQSALDRERQTTSAYRSFVSMISHQFRTPLAIIDSSAQRLMRRGLQIPEEELETRISKIRSAITRLTRLVESVLNAARIDAGQIEFNPRTYDLLELVADACERQRELSPRATITLVTPSFPVEVVCDVILIEQVVSNLLSNAVKYSGNTVSVEVAVTVEEDRIRCSVRDWGVGIPADELPRIFDRFYRARTATGIAGTGIGLDVARQIMQMHGGDIRAESREGEGSVFTFTMPTATAATEPRAA